MDFELRSKDEIAAELVALRKVQTIAVAALVDIASFGEQPDMDGSLRLLDEPGSASAARAALKAIGWGQ